MITLIDPLEIENEKSIIAELKSFGIDHTTKKLTSGWNYVLDHVWITIQLESYLVNKSIDQFHFLDVGCGRSPFHKFLEKKTSINILGIDRPEGYCQQLPSEIVDYRVDFLEFDIFSESSVDIILWVSSIEHNELKDIKTLYEKSVYLLKDGGLFIATVPIANKTSWFKPSEQTNLSIMDAETTFNDQFIGDFDGIQKSYRSNLLYIMDKYRRRYHSPFSSSPLFFPAGVYQIISKNNA